MAIAKTMLGKTRQRKILNNMAVWLDYATAADCRESYGYRCPCCRVFHRGR
jgi:hypothetical protein